REALLAAERGEAAMPPDPFDRERPHAFTEWARSTSSVTGLPARSRLVLLLDAEPALGTPNPLVRLAQKSLLRLLRPLVEHDRRVARALLEIIDASQEKSQRG